MKIELPEKYVKEPIDAPYSPVLTIEGKELVLISGTVCDDWEGQMPETIEEQARCVLKACQARLQDAGCDLENVFNVEVFMADLAQWGDFNKVYREMMPDPKPCRRAVQVGLLPGYLVEVVMWAVK